MSIIIQPFFEENRQIFEKFDEAHLFGSALVKDHPNDIDLILVYGNIPNEVLATECENVKTAVFRHFGIHAHLLVLSRRERDQTRIWEQINSVQLK